MSFSCRNVKLSMHVRLYRLSFARIIFCNFCDYLQSSNPSSSSLLYRTDASECELLARRDFVSDMCTMTSPSTASYASVLINSAQTSFNAAVTHLDHWSPITRASSVSTREACVSWLAIYNLLSY